MKKSKEPTEVVKPVNHKLRLKKFRGGLEELEALAVSGADAITRWFVLEDEDFKSVKIQDLARMMKRLQLLHESLDNTKKRVGVIFDEVRVRHLPTMMDSEDMPKFTVDDLGTVSLTDDLRVKVLDPQKEFEWLEEIGCGDLISNTVNGSSLKALLRRKLVAGEEIPSDIFEVAPFTRATITKR
jgi:hypothetical protein